jgi:oligoendopeptidase F
MIGVLGACIARLYSTPLRELMQGAGVDMTTDQPLELTVKKMNRVMDEIEKLLGVA